MTEMSNRSDEKSLRIRPVTEADAGRLLEIYRPYVEKTAVTFEYEVPSIAEFRERIRKVERKFPYLAAELDGETAGYCYASEFHPRAAYGWCAEVTVYLDMEKRQQGIGKKLYQELEKALKKQNILNLYACIAFPEEEDEYLTRNSMEFHAHMGYRLAGRFQNCGYKFGRWYHMVWMEKIIGEHPEKPRPVIRFTE